VLVHGQRCGLDDKLVLAVAVDGGLAPVPSVVMRLSWPASRAVPSLGSYSG